jgi:hypothetical protein
MLQGDMFGKPQTQELEPHAETCKHRTEGDQAGLWGLALASSAFGTGEESNQGWYVGQVDVRTIAGQDAKAAFPEHLRAKPSFVPDD